MTVSSRVPHRIAPDRLVEHMCPSTPVVPDPGTRNFTPGRPASPHRPVPPHRRQWVLPGRPDQVAQARRLVAESLTACPAAADAVLLTSELAANAVLHTASGSGGTFGVTVSHDASLVRVEVHDAGAPTAPVIVAGDGLRPSGRGLALVAVLAARWGQQGNERGRAVWFELDCP